MRYEEAVQKHEPLTPYEKGLVAGIYRYAWMKDGVYYVGTTGSTLGDAVDRALTEYRESWPPSVGEPDAEIERPDSCPKPGQIPAWDAGWDAQRLGLGRETVEVLSPPGDRREWALLGYDIRAQLAASAGEVASSGTELDRLGSAAVTGIPGSGPANDAAPDDAIDAEALDEAIYEQTGRHPADG